MPARWPTSNSNSCSFTRHLYDFPKALTDVSNDIKASWWMFVIKRVCPKYSRSKNTAHATARHSLRVFDSVCSAPVRVRDQYTTCRAEPSSCCSNSTSPFSESRALVSTVNWPVVRGSSSIDGLVRSV